MLFYFCVPFTKLVILILFSDLVSFKFYFFIWYFVPILCVLKKKDEWIIFSIVTSLLKNMKYIMNLKTKEQC